ncbi:hypothetical protein Hamer_G026333 [Homarus americanus]|uniref:Uncharacterized protein n=1 Tax=Homarus americanus TaxID=6706 RepID=A0A8J5J9L7_HOMAM|nr:hypothetical protein Hamer_G026333 [Homarus americanus]
MGRDGKLVIPGYPGPPFQSHYYPGTRAYSAGSEENPFTNAVAIRDELQLNVSNETVRRRRMRRNPP